MNATDLKSEAQRAFSAWDYLRNDPMASRAQIDEARQRFAELSVRQKAAPVAACATIETNGGRDHE